MDKNITKQIFLKKLFLLTFIVVFVNIYSMFFGVENTLVGVTVITGALMFMDIDMGYDVKQSTLLIIILFTYISFIASLRNMNIFLGFIIHGLSVFGIIYISTENIKTKAYLPFILLYVFIEGNPVTQQQLSTRIWAGFIGGCIMASVLYIIHNKKNNQAKEVLSILKEKIDFSSERFRFSLKMAIGISLAILIGRIIGTEKGMWISIVVMSLTQTHYEQTKERIKKRFISTLLGAIIFIVLFKIILPKEYFVVATLILGYIYTFIEEYGLKMIFATVNALVASMTMLDTSKAIFLRVGFLILGIGVIYVISIIEIRILKKNVYVKQTISE